MQTNLSYCTAIAWLLYQRAGLAKETGGVDNSEVAMA